VLSTYSEDDSGSSDSDEDYFPQSHRYKYDPARPKQIIWHTDPVTPVRCSMPTLLVTLIYVVLLMVILPLSIDNPRALSIVLPTVTAIWFLAILEWRFVYAFCLNKVRGKDPAKARHQQLTDAEEPELNSSGAPIELRTNSNVISQAAHSSFEIGGGSDLENQNPMKTGGDSADGVATDDCGEFVNTNAI
jgi:hypothetical protein